MGKNIGSVGNNLLTVDIKDIIDVDTKDIIEERQKHFFRQNIQTGKNIWLGINIGLAKTYSK